jgi:hypothetical protein
MIQEIILLIISKRKLNMKLILTYVFSSRENAGEEDHSTYNLRILKKPVYALADEYIIPNDDGLGMNHREKYPFE